MTLLEEYADKAEEVQRFFEDTRLPGVAHEEMTAVLFELLREAERKSRNAVRESFVFGWANVDREHKAVFAEMRGEK